MYVPSSFSRLHRTCEKNPAQLLFVFFPHQRLFFLRSPVARICVRAFLVQSSAPHLRKKSCATFICLFMHLRLAPLFCQKADR
jgi:hypothetical protein